MGETASDDRQAQLDELKAAQSSVLKLRYLEKLREEARARRSKLGHA